MMKVLGRKEGLKGFSLLELIIVLVIITMLATFSVPQVNMWVAQHRARKSIAHLLADFNRARSFAMTASVEKQNEMITRRPVIALEFTSDSHRLIQRLDSSLSNWGSLATDTLIRRTNVQHNVDILRVNGSELSSPVVLLFTSSGQVKNTSGAGGTVLIPSMITNTNCGGDESPIKEIAISNIVLESRVSDSVSMFYYIEIGPNGESFVCMNETTEFSSGGKVVDI